VGNSSVLTCPLKGHVTMLKWTITPEAGDQCTLTYRFDKNETHRTNCSDNINWTFRAAQLCQTNSMHAPCWCFAAPPRLSLSCDEQGSPVCEAAAGKPPAQLSWVPEGSSTAEEKRHDNGTVTVLSKFTACSTNVTNVTTCVVSHPAGNWSQSISC
ncbi:MOR1A protein, partial [Calcarius ornatus]|nr:MOR1A protein [Calcarius ornatus]